MKLFVLLYLFGGKQYISQDSLINRSSKEHNLLIHKSFIALWMSLLLRLKEDLLKMFNCKYKLLRSTRRIQSASCWKQNENMTLEHKYSHTQHRYICSNSQQYIVWLKIIHFSFMPKKIRILRSCSMKIFSKFPTVHISKLNFLLVICIAKNLIWTTLKMIFSIFRFFCILRFQIYKYCPIITNHTLMERLLIQLSDDV